MSLIFEKQIQVTEEHIDGNNHVNNVQYVHWVEEIAGEHWDFVKHKTEFSEFAGCFWIIIFNIKNRCILMTLLP
jgi:acyl-CoA thioester hydrolase